MRALLVLLLGTILLIATEHLGAQEIEARAYSNAPTGINFVTGGIAQAKSGSYTLTTEAVNLTRIVDVFGQSGRISLLLPYAQLSGTGTLGPQNIESHSEPTAKAFQLMTLLLGVLQLSVVLTKHLS